MDTDAETNIPSPTSIVILLKASGTYGPAGDEARSSDTGKQKASNDTFGMKLTNSHSIDKNHKQITDDSHQQYQHQKSPSTPRQLPSEIVDLIITLFYKEQQNLYECALVSKQFYLIANPLLWSTVKFYPRGIQRRRFLSGLFTTTPERQQTLGQHIRDLSIHVNWTDDEFMRLLPKIPFVERIDLDGKSSITNASFQHAPQLCQHLTSLAFTSSDITHVTFAAIGEYCRQLRELEWYMASGQSATWLTSLRNCPLVRLTFYSYQYDAPAPLDRNTMTFIKQFNRLTCLGAIYNGYIDSKFFLLVTPPLPTSSASNNSRLKQVLASAATTTPPWPLLTDLRLGSDNDMDDATFTAFLQSHPCIRDMEVTQFRELTSNGLEAIATWLPRLTHLTLSGSDHITVDEIQHMICQCLPLKYLSLYHCRHISVGLLAELLDSYEGDHSDDLIFDQELIDRVRKKAAKEEQQVPSD